MELLGQFPGVGAERFHPGLHPAPLLSTPQALPGLLPALKTFSSAEPRPGPACVHRPHGRPWWQHSLWSVFSAAPGTRRWEGASLRPSLASLLRSLFLPAPSSKARFNFLEGETQVLRTHLTLKTQEPENSKGSKTGNASPLSRASPQRPGGGEQSDPSTWGWGSWGTAREAPHPHPEVRLLGSAPHMGLMMTGRMLTPLPGGCPPTGWLCSVPGDRSCPADGGRAIHLSCRGEPG